MGFNMKKEIFSDENGALVRKAFITAVDRKWIAQNIVHDATVPVGVIPPGVEGYDPDLTPYAFDPPKAKAMMRSAGYPTSDPRLKTLTMVHTDGALTTEIAMWIKRYLITLGVDLQLVSVSYTDYVAWAGSIRSGKYDLFLMGFKPVLFTQVLIGDKNARTFHKIDCDLIPSAEAIVFLPSYDDAVSAGYAPCRLCKPTRKGGIGGLDLLDPLFRSDSDDNLMFYSNPRVDSLLDQTSRLDEAQRKEREAKLGEISRILLDDPPMMPLFYITAL